jgi:hypothetical protein
VQGAQIRYYFYNEWRPDMPTPSPSLSGSILFSREGGSPSASAWLLSYPTFRNALQREETDFVALPPYVRLPVLKRMTGQEAGTASVWRADLRGVRASYIELSTPCVADVLRDYLSAGARNPECSGAPDELETLSSIFPAATVPLVARPPCLLSPGAGFFLEGWARFLAYWLRNDRTIPMLAVDWPVLCGRLTGD